ncbi:hypothetical protein FRC02_008710, partial [Tulasnella sp. 418]
MRSTYLLPLVLPFLSVVSAAPAINATTAEALPACPDRSTATYDYIVAGAGAGGGPIAARLALKGWKVLLIDAGHDHVNVNTTVPLYLVRASEDPQIQLDYNVKHYPPGDPNQDLTWYPRATAIGGSVIHNALINLIPHKWDFNQIQSMFATSRGSRTTTTFRNCWGNSKDMAMMDGWTLSSLPFLLLGPSNLDAQLATVFGAVIAEKLPIPGDWNVWANDEVSGGGFVIMTKKEDGTRSSIRDHLVKTKTDKPTRLTFQTDTLVTKILNCRETDGSIRAYGVQTVVAPTGESLLPGSPRFTGKFTNPTYTTFTAKNEIILSTGPFQTPQTLMLSGIGASTQLLNNGIDPLIDLPGVGENLQDRVEEVVLWHLKKDHKIWDGCVLGETAASDPCLAEWQNDGHKNLYSSSAAIYAWSHKSDNSLPYRDVFSFWTPAAFKGYYKGWGEETASDHRAFVNVILKAHTKAKGWVRLTGNHPQDTLEINKNQFQTPESLNDLHVVREEMKKSRQFAQNSLLFKANVDAEVFPGPNVQTDEELDEFIKKNQWGHHACCTAKMGVESDNMAVVDNNFKVYGVKGLRVLDNS